MKKHVGLYLSTCCFWHIKLHQLQVDWTCNTFMSEKASSELCQITPSQTLTPHWFQHLKDVVYSFRGSGLVTYPSNNNFSFPLFKVCNRGPRWPVLRKKTRCLPVVMRSFFNPISSHLTNWFVPSFSGNEATKNELSDEAWWAKCEKETAILGNKHKASIICVGVNLDFCFIVSKSFSEDFRQFKFIYKMTFDIKSILLGFPQDDLDTNYI